MTRQQFPHLRVWEEGEGGFDGFLISSLRTNLTEIRVRRNFTHHKKYEVPHRKKYRWLKNLGLSPPN